MADAADHRLWDYLVYATAAAMTAGGGNHLSPYVPSATCAKQGLPAARQATPSRFCGLCSQCDDKLGLLQLFLKILRDSYLHLAVEIRP